MLIYSFHEILWILLVAILIDLWIGDPKWPTHPVIMMGRATSYFERIWLRPHLLLDTKTRRRKAFSERWKGMGLAVVVPLLTLGISFATGYLCMLIHPWLGYAFHAWFISTTIAVKGLKDAAMQVYISLSQGSLPKARKYVGYIVGRNTDQLDEQEISRAAVETVAENTMDGFISPLLFAFLGAAPLALGYRAVNTLDSMVGYKNDKYVHFGWASARFDDLLNYIPARLTGLLFILVSIVIPGLNGRRAYRSIREFAADHPSPNSGIPESAVAGALGIQLGGTNRYGDVISERARMGWPIRNLQKQDIVKTCRMLLSTAYVMIGGIICILCLLHFGIGWLL